MAIKRDKIRLVSSAGTGHFYTTDKNKKNTPDKMEVRKYDPVVRKHVIYKEGKIKLRNGPRAQRVVNRCVIPNTAQPGSGIQFYGMTSSRAAHGRALTRDPVSLPSRHPGHGAAVIRDPATLNN